MEKFDETLAGVVFKEVREKPKVALLIHLENFLESIIGDENELICHV